MNRPIPAGDYVEHFDPELPHHRAWLEAVLEQLVSHDPQALQEGGSLRRLWIQHQQDTLAAEQAAGQAAATGSRYPNPLVGVPCFQQRDSAQRSQRDRSCFSSSCAMLLEAIRPGTLPGVNGDDQYLAVVQRYGDTTDATAQLQALAHYGITAQLVQDADLSKRWQKLKIVVSSGTLSLIRLMPANRRMVGTSIRASSIAGSQRGYHCCNRWIRSIVASGYGGRPPFLLVLGK
jgi:hypothetical protein